MTLYVDNINSTTFSATTFSADTVYIGGNQISTTSSSFGSFSATTLYSGSTDLSTYFGNEVTNRNNLLNTKTNLSGATFTGTVNTLTLSATTLSATTLYSGSTDLSTYFGNEVTNRNSLLNTKANLSGNTFTGTINTPILSATTLSASTLIVNNINVNSTGSTFNSLSSTTDITITNSSNGFVCKSPDNSFWRITIDNLGILTTTKI